MEPAGILSKVCSGAIEDLGEIFLGAALGHPQVRCCSWAFAFKPEYSGRAKLADVALQLRIVKGESMDISK